MFEKFPAGPENPLPTRSRERRPFDSQGKLIAVMVSGGGGGGPPFPWSCRPQKFATFVLSWTTNGSAANPATTGANWKEIVTVSGASKTPITPKSLMTGAPTVL